MGSVYELSTKLLIAIDVSGSVSSKSISHFLKVIERFFKNGISEIDVIQFDANVKKEVVSLREYHKRFQNGFKVTGRGGTNFQPIFDYLKQNNKYDGLVIMTDGYAPKPSIDFYIRAKVLWVLEDEECYRKNRKVPIFSFSDLTRRGTIFISTRAYTKKIPLKTIHTQH